MKQVSNVYTLNDSVTSPLYNVFGNDMTFYKVTSFNDVNFTNYSASHLWSNLNMYSEISYNTTNKSIFEGGLLNSAFEDLPSAFWTTGMVVASFNADTFRVNFDGYNFGMNIPLDPAVSGLTGTTLYASYIWQPNSLLVNPQSLCSGTRADSQTSESTVQFTDKIGIGFNFVEGINPATPTDMFNSGIVYLVTDDIYQTFTGGTGSSLSWSYQQLTTNKYANGARTIDVSFASTQHPLYYDKIVGLVNLNSGMVYIWNPTLVSQFNWSGFTGDPYTGATTTSGNTYAIVQDMDTSVSLAVDIIVKPGEWQNTTNPSIIGETCGTVFTSICLYDEKGQLMGVATPSEAIPLPVQGFTPITLEVPISGSINDSTGIWTTGVTLAL